MKTKLVLLTGISFVFLFLAGFIANQKLAIPPFPEELTTLTVAKTNSLKNINQSEKAKILTNILGSEDLQNEKIFFLRNSFQLFSNNVESVRYTNLIFLLMALFFMALTLNEFNQKKIVILATVIIIFCSPLFFDIWIAHPKISLTIFLLSFWSYLKFSSNPNRLKKFLLLLANLLILFSSFQGFFIGMVLALITIKSQMEAKKYLLTVAASAVFIVVLISTFQNSSFKKYFFNLPIINHSSLSYVSEEITARIGQEDSLKEKVAFPLWFRRISYNKIFFIYKNIVVELLNFFDPETWFFQEVHPLGQKSEVIFFWPEIFFFVIGLAALIKNKNKNFKQFMGILFILSVSFYLTTINETPSIKYSLLLFCFSIVIAYGLSAKFKIVPTLLIILSLWGAVISYYDMGKRPLFWFDNRPFVYKEGIQGIKETAVSSFKPNSVVITSIIGNPKLYFLYYFNAPSNIFLSNKDTVIYNDIKYTFNSFDLKINQPENKTLYLGFLGEYIGSNPKNDFSADQDLNKIKNLGIDIKKTWITYDTIAYRYSNYVILGYYP